ncbi:MAG: thioesterase [Frankiales bacterium]|nr:thioesterase [Frankiales bacterium]
MSDLRPLRDGSLSDVLPPHYPTCLGCGPDAAHGYHLSVRRDGEDAVVTDYVFGPEKSGAPGIAHGGAVATVADDVLGYLLHVARVPGVTRRLEVDYLKPVLVGVTYTVRAQLDRRDGRKLFVSCAGTGPDGVEAFRATGLFLVVGLSHFQVGATSGEGRPPVAP